MNTYLSWVTAILGGLLIAPAVLATPPQSSTNHATTATPSAKPKVCFTDVFSGPLPGKADYCLGMRDWNKGDYASGLDLLKRAAGWGNKNAQYTLGLIYYGGHHVPTNIALGMAWLTLADERHNDDQISRVREAAFKWATTAERHQAEQLFRRMQGTYGDTVAATRALRHLQHWRRSHDRNNSGCIRLSGPQAAEARRLGLAGEPPQSIRSQLRPNTPISVVGTGGGGGSAKASAKAAAIVAKSKRLARQARIRFSNANSGACVTIQMQHNVTRKLADKYFAGWLGVVSVGPLETVPASAVSTEH